jgi:hypothetical protein
MGAPSRTSKRTNRGEAEGEGKFISPPAPLGTLCAAGLLQDALLRRLLTHATVAIPYGSACSPFGRIWVRKREGDWGLDEEESRGLGRRGGSGLGGKRWVGRGEGRDGDGSGPPSSGSGDAAATRLLVESRGGREQGRG